MPLRFVFVPRNHWPTLAWVAKCIKGKNHIEVQHGSQVETQPLWVSEAVWDGPFSSGDFDRTDLVFGSGIRLRDDKAYFVPAGSTVDRLVYCDTAETLYVSNSLPALTASVNATIDPTYKHFYENFRTIVDGVEKYLREVPTSNPPIRLAYFHNLLYDGRTLSVVEKPFGQRTFASFTEYRTFLEDSLISIGQNMADPARKHRYTPLGTLSTGYDSPTVAVLSRLIGNTEVLTFQRGRGGTEDDGTEIARRLDLKPIALDRDAWRQEPESPIPFIAANAYGEEVHYTGARQHLSGRVLLTGYHGDKMWDTSTHDLSAAIKRGDPSGLALTETRLWMGFLHCPVAFFGVRNIADVYQISTSEEMKPWRVGGDYDRPICRRIVEQEGIPRELFGTRKSAASVVLWDRSEGFLPTETMRQYTGWLERRSTEWLKNRELPPMWAIRVRRLKESVRSTLGKNSAGVPPSDYLFRHLFPWALEGARQRYGRVEGAAA